MSYPGPLYRTAYPTGLVAAVVFVVLLMGLFGEWCNPVLRYERASVLSGQLWRIWTGHLVHLGIRHTLMNLGALVLILHVFGPLLRVRDWLMVSGFTALGISAGFLVLNPELLFYAGFSGVLHGWLVLALIVALVRDRRHPRWVLAVVFFAVAGKLISEQLPGYNIDYLRHHMNAPVIVDAHLYGAICGLLLAPFYFKRQS